MRGAETGEGEAVILVRAMTPIGEGVGDDIAIGALDLYGRWLSLAPVSFRRADDALRFDRWDRIRFRWRRPANEQGPAEALRVDQRSIEIVGAVPPSEQPTLLNGIVTQDLAAQRAAGRGLALVQADILGFSHERVGAAELIRRGARLAQLRERLELFGTAHVLPSEPCPYDFIYQIRDAGNVRHILCHDWELEAAFLKLRKQQGEAEALQALARRYSRELPAKGMGLIVRMPGAEAESWRVNGAIPVQPVAQPAFL